MSSHQSSSYSYSSSSYTSSTSTGGSDGQVHTKSYSERSSYNDRDGGKVERRSDETGKPTIVETTEIPAGGRQLGGATNEQGRIEDVSDKDQEYLDRMEDEYAKREGGA